MTDRHTWAASVVAASPGEHLLEIGCGAGRAAELVLHDLGTTGSLVAIDRSATAVRQAGQRCAADVASARLRVEQVGLAEFEAPRGSFDGAWAMNVNAFWTGDPAAELGVLRRILRPGARLLLLWDAGPTTGGKLEPVAEHLATAGFTAIEQHSEAGGTIVRATAPRTPPLE